jgi:hypothetical protein
MTTRHGIRVRVPLVNCVLYFIEYELTWARLQHFFYWDPVLKREAATQEIFIPAEKLIQGPAVVYNQKPLYHAFYEATLNPLFLTNLVVSSTVADTPYGPTKTVTMKDGTSFQMGTAWDKRPLGAYYRNQMATTSIGDTIAYSTVYNSAGQKLEEREVRADWNRLPMSSYQGEPVCYFSLYNWRYASCDLGSGLDQDGKVPFVKWNFKPVLQTSMSGKRVCAVKPSDFDVSRFSLTEGGALPALPTIAHGIPKNLTDRIYSQLAIPNVNNMENIANVKSLKKMIPNLRRALTKRSFKSFAELYLFWKYEYSTTAMDLKAYYAYFQMVGRRAASDTQMIRISGPSEYNSQATTRYSISLPTFTASLLESLGLTPSLSNTWDCLPFTFVVDWFVGLGDVLQRIHQEKILATLKIRYCTVSTELNDSVKILVGPFAGECVGRSIYYRTCNTAIPTPDVDVVFKNPIRHLLDGTALIVAMRR